MGKGHDRNGSDTLFVVLGGFPSGLCKNKVLLIFFLPQLHYQVKINYTGLQSGRIFPNIFPNIWLCRSDPLNILSSVYVHTSLSEEQKQVKYATNE